MIDDAPHDGEDCTAATENRIDPPTSEQGQGGGDGIEVFGAAPLVDDSGPTPTAADTEASHGGDLALDLAALEATIQATVDHLGDSTALDSTPEPDDSPRSEPVAGAASPGSVDTVADTLSLLDRRLAAIEEQLDGLSRMTGHLPPKLRGLSTKLEDLAAPLADATTRSLMVDLFMLDDLSRAALGRDDDSNAAERALAAVVQMLGQLFEQREITTIPTDVPFDPTLHQAVERLPVDDPAHDGQILEVYRRGYRSGSRVLRFAEVGVAYHQADLETDDDGFDDDGPASDA